MRTEGPEKEKKLLQKRQNSENRKQFLEVVVSKSLNLLAMNETNK